MRLAVFGHCYASNDHLHAGLDAVARGRWRELTRWPGSYAVVADDGAATTVITDVAGVRPVYYAEHAGGWAWATQAKPLAALIGAPVDHLALLKRLLFPTVPEITGTETAFAGVHRLPGGHLIRFGEDPRPTAYEPMGGTVFFGDAALSLRRALTSAVGARVSGVSGVTADFSGGLDSTSLALLAAHTGKRVLAVTHDDPANPGDDAAFAVRAASESPAIEHVVVGRRGGAMFFDRMDEAPPTDQPFSDAARWALRADYHRVALEYGSDVHFTGSGGDTLLSASPLHLADLVCWGRLGGLAHQARLYARLRHKSLGPVLAGAVRLSRTSYAQALREAAEILSRTPDERKRARWRPGWCAPAGSTAWLTVQAREQITRAVVEAADRVDEHGLVSMHRAWADVREFGTYQAELEAQIEATGVPVHAPFLDHEVVRACMSIPVHERLATDRQKPLLGAALRGLVPDFLLDRRTKGSYDALAFAGLRRNAARLEHLIGNSGLGEVGLIDTEFAERELRRLVAGAPGRLAALEAYVATELWLFQYVATPCRGIWRKEEARDRDLA